MKSTSLGLELMNSSGRKTWILVMYLLLLYNIPQWWEQHVCLLNPSSSGTALYRFASVGYVFVNHNDQNIRWEWGVGSGLQPDFAADFGMSDPWCRDSFQVPGSGLQMGKHLEVTDVLRRIIWCYFCCGYRMQVTFFSSSSTWLNQQGACKCTGQHLKS